MGDKPQATDSLASRLKSSRVDAGLSQAQAAGVLQMHRPTISEIEAGRRKVSTEELIHFAETYGVSTAWLLGEESGAESATRDLRLAARELSSLREEDLAKVVELIQSLQGRR